MDSKPIIIGLAGRKGSGKDMGAHLLAQIASHDYLKSSMSSSFAGPMKKMLQVGLDLSEQQLHDHEAKETVDTRYGVSPRHMMQTIGTEWGRNMICDDIWLKCMQNTINSCKLDVLFITDVRFENEANFIRKQGGTIIHVFNSRQQDQEGDSHISEQPLEQYGADFIAYFDTVENYHTRLKKIFSQIANPVDWKISQRVGIKPMSPRDAAVQVNVINP